MSRQHVKLAALLLLLTAACGSETHSEPPAPTEQEPLRWAVQEEREEMEREIRMSLFLKCGGDGERRCQQLAPFIWRGVRPTIPVTDVRCSGGGPTPRKIRNCTFTVGRTDKSVAHCSIMLTEHAGHHNAYWSDDLPLVKPEMSQAGALPNIPRRRSSLTCTASVLALTDEAEPVDNAPALLPRLAKNPSELLTASDYPTVSFEGRPDGPVTMKLLVASHGHVDRCTAL